MMEKLKIAAITEYGLERSAKKEIEEIIGVKAKQEETILTFEIDNNKKFLEKLFIFTIKSQAVTKLLFLIDKFEFKDNLIEKLKSSIKKENFNYWFKDKPKFYVRCKHNKSDISSRKIEPLVGEIIIEENKDLDVSIENADIKVLLYVYKNKAVFGIDMTNDDLSKREYKLINSGKSLNATLAYHLIREIGFNEKDILLDANSKTAEIVIESALYLSGMHNYYKKDFRYKELKPFQKIDTDALIKDYKKKAKKKLKELDKNIYAYSELLRHMESGKRNAKVAGVLDLIEFSKVSMEWLDIKFDEEDVDKIVTVLPSKSKRVTIKESKEICREFFYQIKFILKENGLLGILIQKPEKFLELMKKEKYLDLQSSDKIRIGELEFHYLIIKKTVKYKNLKKK